MGCKILAVLFVIWMALMAFGLYNRYFKHICLCDFFGKNESVGKCGRCGNIRDESGKIIK